MYIFILFSKELERLLSLLEEVLTLFKIFNWLLMELETSLVLLAFSSAKCVTEKISFLVFSQLLVNVFAEFKTLVISVDTLTTRLDTSLNAFIASKSEIFCSSTTEFTVVI